MFGSVTGEAIFEAYTCIFDVLCPDWRLRQVGCTSNGEAKMTGVNKGFVSRVQNAVQELVLSEFGA